MQEFSKNIVAVSFKDSDFIDFLKKEFGNEIFTKWLSQLAIESHCLGEVIFSAPSKFIRDWVLREFFEKKPFKKALQKDFPTIKRVSVICLDEGIKSASANQNNLPSSHTIVEKVSNLSKYDNVFAFGTELNPRYTFETFVSVKYNKMASSMARIAAGIDTQIDLFEDKIPLFIHGAVGSGKTHLAQAIAWKIKELKSDKRVVYLSAEKFMYHFVQSIRSNDVMSFKEKMRSIDVLIVDDVQFISGKESTQQEFMNCFNALVESNKQVVLVCDRCPSDLENIDEKLKSRISSGMVINFKKPDYSDRMAIARNKAKTLGHEFSEEVLVFLAEKITSSVRDLEGAIKKLIAVKLLDEEEINLGSVKVALSGYIKQSSRSAIGLEKIQKVVAEFYEIKISDLVSASRLRVFVRPRQIAMLLAKTLTSESLPKIGSAFGKNHATVIHSIKVAEKMALEDANFADQVERIRQILG